MIKFMPNQPPSFLRDMTQDGLQFCIRHSGDGRDEEEEICNVLHSPLAQSDRAALHRPLYAIAAICGLLSGESVRIFLGCAA